MAYLKYEDFSLPKLNSDNNQWVDHIEFFCYISQEGAITEQQVIDRILDENSNNPLEAIEDVIDQDDLETLLTALDNDDEIIEDEIVDPSDDNAALTDRIASKVNTYFDFLKARQDNFGDDYPFIISASNNEITLREGLSTTQKLYIILLCSSLLRLATRSGLNRLGHHFEELCAPVFKKLTPENTQNIFFGSGAGTTIGTTITGTFHSKVLQLCDLLHVSPRTNFTPQNAGIHNVGDGGLDWVGVFDFEDSQLSQPTFFGQCACGSDWIDKEFDAHISKWKNYIQFSNGYLTYHFVPRHLRDESLSWDNPLNIYDVVLIDRFRIICLLKTETNLSDLISDIYQPFLDEVENNKIDSFT